MNPYPSHSPSPPGARLRDRVQEEGRPHHLVQDLAQDPVPDGLPHRVRAKVCHRNLVQDPGELRDQAPIQVPDPVPDPVRHRRAVRAQVRHQHALPHPLPDAGALQHHLRHPVYPSLRDEDQGAVPDALRDPVRAQLRHCRQEQGHLQDLLPQASLWVIGAVGLAAYSHSIAVSSLSNLSSESHTVFFSFRL